jgi:hypothetical protein
MATSGGAPAGAAVTMSSSTYTLWCHDAHGKMSADELVVSPEVFPGIRAGDLLFMWDPALSSSSSAPPPTGGSAAGGAHTAAPPPPISARRRRRREQERGALLLAVSRLHGPPSSTPSAASSKGALCSLLSSHVPTSWGARLTGVANAQREWVCRDHAQLCKYAAGEPQQQDRGSLWLCSAAGHRGRGSFSRDRAAGALAPLLPSDE